MITIKNLMTLERILLEINIKYKFELFFNSAYKLYNYLIEIGRITNYSFQIQDEYYQTTKDEEKMKAFHEKVLNGEVDYDWGKAAMFIGELMEELKNDEVNEMVNKLKFW
jgi:hypothetical protein